MSSGAAAAGAAHRARMNAIRSFGTIVTVTAEELLKIIEKDDEPLIVTSTGGFFSVEYRYLVPYRGLAFYATTSYPLVLPDRAEIVQASKVYLPT